MTMNTATRAVTNTASTAVIAATTALAIARRRHFSERGEGVISTAIAVLVIAFLGVAMWIAFRSIFSDAADTTRQQVQQVGH